MKTILFTSIAAFFIFACGTKPDVATEVKTIDSLDVEVSKALVEAKGMDTSWLTPLSFTAMENIEKLKKVYTPDSIDSDLARKVTFYKGFRKIGKRYQGDRLKFIEELEKSRKQLNDLKTDAENGAVEKDLLHKYLNEEKLVTTDLLFKFKEFKAGVEQVKIDFDSLNPMIEKLIEVYEPMYQERMNSGRTIH